MMRNPTVGEKLSARCSDLLPTIKPVVGAVGATDGPDGPGQALAPNLTQPLRKWFIASCVLRLANLDNGVFERLGRYEAATVAMQAVAPTHSCATVWMS